jgi:hypothetical protein
VYLHFPVKLDHLLAFQRSDGIRSEPCDPLLGNLQLLDDVFHPLLGIAE